ncbi:hypothetical protein ARMGADRAFT_465226 [Armillaria gallica]|uniref:Uncharacterized protein n=1 Tax=Armillaria gallica TaxID=47427 RepID=A0A2H3D0Q1_ARMGA|nr:hypothetical protein ARMGADRAFT_465226 [Armillaria gallica]
MRQMCISRISWCYWNQLALSGSIRKTRKSITADPYNTPLLTPEYLLGLLFEKLRLTVESVYGQNLGGTVVSIPSFYVTDFQRRVLHSLLASNLEVRQIIPAGTAATLAHGYPSQGHRFIDYYLLICTKERCGIQFNFFFFCGTFGMASHTLHRRGPSLQGGGRANDAVLSGFNSMTMDMMRCSRSLKVFRERELSKNY